MQGAAIMGMNFHLVCPKELNPTDELLNRCKILPLKMVATY